jgi:cyclopropane-fatty-acyl-phospholipid synthase
MKASSLSSRRHLAGTAKPGLFDGVARRAVLSRLAQLDRDRVTLVEGEAVRQFGAEAPGGLAAQITVLDARFYTEVAFGGSIGAGEAWMHGYWECDDLVALVRILLRNREVLDGMEGGLARLTAPLQALFHRLNRNSRAGSRRNIAAHYDLGNDFFGLWLDETMMYSSAMFAEPGMSLHAAQVHRLDHICRRLDLQPTDHVIEIGTGWGGFALHAAQHYGCRVTTTTISREQYLEARQRVVAAGLEDRVTLLQDDFRDLGGQYDKLVSIEMIEAVDHAQLPTYFAKCSELLAPHGAMLIQAITMADQRYEEYRKSVDFIRRYIFPGGNLPSTAVMADCAARETDLRLLGLDDIGLHYAETLRRWRHAFSAKLEAVRRMGYPESFIRMWTFYLGYCEGAFLERAISDVLMLWSKPESRLCTV